MEELPVWNVCSVQVNGISFKEKSLIDCDTMTVSLSCTNVNIRSVLILTVLHSEFVVERLSASIHFPLSQF